MNEKMINIIVHVLIVALIATIEWFSESQILLFFVNFFIFTGLFYLNYFFLGKWVLKKPEFTTLVFWGIINCLILFVFNLIIISLNYSGKILNINKIIIDVFMSVIWGFKHLAPICLAGFVYKHWYLNKDKNRQLETIKTSHQIQILKNSFSIDLVNKTLIQMKAKAAESPESIQEYVLMLSNLLRYKLYESSSSKVSLKKELDVAKDQINLSNSLFKTNFNLKNELDSDIKIKAGNLLNSVDDILNKYPEQDLELLVKLINSKCFLTAINETKNIKENFQLN